MDRLEAERKLAAGILGSKSGGKKAKAARENGRKGGRPIIKVKFKIKRKKKHD